MTASNKPSRECPIAGLFFGRNRAEGGPAARRKRAGLRPNSLGRSTALLFPTASIALMQVAGSAFADGGAGGDAAGISGSGGAGGIETNPNGEDGAASGGGSGGAGCALALLTDSTSHAAQSGLPRLCRGIVAAIQPRSAHQHGKPVRAARKGITT